MIHASSMLEFAASVIMDFTFEACWFLLKEKKRKEKETREFSSCVIFVYGYVYLSIYLSGEITPSTSSSLPKTKKKR